MFDSASVEGLNLSLGVRVEGYHIGEPLLITVYLYIQIHYGNLT